jgi:hypothetical protein
LITPGIDTGVTEEPLKHPALPKDAPRPGSPASTKKTLWPSRCSQLAAHTPTMPAPITPTRFAPTAGIAALLPKPESILAAVSPKSERWRGCGRQRHRLFETIRRGAGAVERGGLEIRRRPCARIMYPR